MAKVGCKWWMLVSAKLFPGKSNLRKFSFGESLGLNLRDFCGVKATCVGFLGDTVI